MWRHDGEAGALASSRSVTSRTPLQGVCVSLCTCITVQCAPYPWGLRSRTPPWMPETTDAIAPDCHQSEHFSVSVLIFQPQTECLFHLNQALTHTGTIPFAV